jgi:hypothetical protein
VQQSRTTFGNCTSIGRQHVVRPSGRGPPFLPSASSLRQARRDSRSVSSGARDGRRIAAILSGFNATSITSLAWYAETTGADVRDWEAGAVIPHLGITLASVGHSRSGGESHAPQPDPPDFLGPFRSLSGERLVAHRPTWLAPIRHCPDRSGVTLPISRHLGQAMPG